MKEGWELSLGDKIGYVIIAGPGHLHEKAKPYVLASYDEIDIEYYVAKQLVPAASRILNLFDVTKDELQPSETPSLSKFMKS